MRLRTSRAAAACICLAALAAAARAEDDPRRALGTYERKGDYRQQVKITPGKSADRVRATFEVSTRGCIGEATMNGIRAGADRYVFSQMVDGPDKREMCTINVTSSDGFRTIRVAHEYCFGLYGAACDFNGSLKRLR